MQVVKSLYRSMHVRNEARRALRRLVQRRHLSIHEAKSSISAAAPVRAGAPLKLAIIGSGPAGFYSAHRIMTRLPDARVDMFEKLPVPFGLVRFGVAPDHPEVKNCEDKFFDVASSPNFNFAGNVEVGKDLPLQVLSQNYDAILFAYGASQDRTLGIPGEHLQGVLSARAFVGWYNGLPEYASLAPRLDCSDVAAVIGNGNVALDVARILLTDLDSLRKTDISESALESLSQSRIRRVHIVGRRGPFQASFTVKEVRELMELSNVGFHPIPKELFPPPDIRLPRVPKRMLQLLSARSKFEPGVASKTWSLDFLQSPVRFRESASSAEGLDSIDLSRNVFVEGGIPYAPDTKVKAAREMSNLKTSLALRSVGYKAEPLPGMAELGIHFDHAKGIIPNIVGKVVSASGVLPGLYCTGWVKIGPTGVIATTMADAFMAAEAIAEDWRHSASTKPGWDGIKGLIPHRISWEAWLQINKAEIARGRANGKPREKFSSVMSMIQAAR